MVAGRVRTHVADDLSRFAKPVRSIARRRRHHAEGGSLVGVPAPSLARLYSSDDALPETTLSRAERTNSSVVLHVPIRGLRAILERPRRA